MDNDYSKLVTQGTQGWFPILRDRDTDSEHTQSIAARLSMWVGISRTYALCWTVRMRLPSAYPPIVSELADPMRIHIREYPLFQT